MTHKEQCIAVAVDGGGSGSRILIFDKKGQVLDLFKGPPLNYAALGRDKFEENIRQISLKLKTSYNYSLEDFVFSLAGSSKFRGEILSILAKELGSKRIWLITDIEAAYMAATRGRDAIIVSSGTGSFAYGRKSGKEARAGGWGYLFDDEGSAYWIGRELLRRIFMCYDGRIKGCEILREKFLEHVGAEKVEDSLPILYREYNTPYRIAQFSKLACEAAAQGDGVALSVLEDAATELEKLVSAVESRLGFTEKVEVYGVGSVITNCELFARILKERIEEKGRIFNVSTTPTVAGCVFYYLTRIERVSPKECWKINIEI